MAEFIRCPEKTIIVLLVTKKYDDMLEFIKLRKKIVGVLFVIFVPVVRNKT